jgi:MFS transporter, ACS family, hexuronate transporter
MQLKTDTMEDQKIGNYRWAVVTLLFFATTINYLDRQVIGLLKPMLEVEFAWTESDYSNIVMAFSAAYAVGMLIFGGVVDRIGTKLGYAVSIVVWSFAAMGHAIAKTTFGFGVARTILGLGEAGNFPVAIKAVAEWFPKKQRAFATGIFNSGSNIAAMFGPLVIMWLYYSYSWQHAFFWTGAIGFIWLAFWWYLYEVPAKHKKLQKAEFDFIHSDQEENAEEANGQKIGWLTILGVRQTWAFVLGKFLTDAVWWFYLFWIPSFIKSSYGLDLKNSWMHISTIYVAASFGSILGGYLSGYLINKGWAVYKARKTAMLIFAMCVVPIILVRFTSDVWIAVALISLAAAAHQAWSANIFTTASDMFPKKAVSSVVGIGGMAGSVGGILFPLLIGIILDSYKLSGDITAGYNIIFMICGSAYLVAWGVMHVLAPKMEKVRV